MNTATLNNCTVPELLRLAEGTDDPLARRLAALVEAREAENDRLRARVLELENGL